MEVHAHCGLRGNVCRHMEQDFFGLARSPTEQKSPRHSATSAAIPGGNELDGNDPAEEIRPIRPTKPDGASFNQAETRAFEQQRSAS